MLQRNLKFIAILLIAGVFYGCAATNPNIESAKIQIKNKAYNQALQAANDAIEQDSTNGLGYFYKGVALSELAGQQETLDERRKYYERMKDAFDNAQKYFAQEDSPPQEADRIDVILATTWAQEHNRGVKYLTVDSLKGQEGYRKAVDHFNNATTVQPDSIMSYDALTQAYLQMDPRDFDGAIKSLEKSINMQDSASAQQYQQLSQIYVLNDNLKKATKTLEEGRELYPDTLSLVRQLTDAYFKLGRRDDALNMVRDLIEKEPDNPRYYKVLGTQIYQSAQPLNDTLRNNFDRLFQLQTEKTKADDEEKVKEVKQTISQLEKENAMLQDSLADLQQRAVENLRKVVELDPEDHDTYETLGIIYQNSAAIFDSKRNITIDNELANKYDKRAREELKKALKYYQKAVEIEPDEKSYWQKLFRVYSRLGMEDKAKEAGRKAGIDI